MSRPAGLGSQRAVSFLWDGSLVGSQRAAQIQPDSKNAPPSLQPLRSSNLLPHFQRLWGGQGRAEGSERGSAVSAGHRWAPPPCQAGDITSQYHLHPPCPFMHGAVFSPEQGDWLSEAELLEAHPREESILPGGHRQPTRALTNLLPTGATAPRAVFVSSSEQVPRSTQPARGITHTACQLFHQHSRAHKTS